MQSRKAAHFEFTGVRQEKLYDVSVYPAGDGITVLWQDITRRRQIEAQRDRLLQQNLEQLDLLMTERSRLETVLAQSPVAILVVDARGGIRYCNQIFQQMVGQSIPYGEDYTSHAGLPLCYPDGGRVEPRLRPVVRAALDGETIIDYEYDILQPGGKRINILGNAAPIQDAEGKIIGAVAVFSDITGRKQAARYDAFLHELSQWLITVRSPEEAMRGVTKKIGQFLNVDRCFMSELDIKGNLHTLLCHYHDGAVRVLPNTPIHFLPDPVRQELQSGHAVTAEDASTDPVFQAAPVEIFNQYSIRAILAIPWQNEEGTFEGILGIADRQPHHWSRDTIEFLTTAANLAWMSVRNAHLYQDLQTSRERFDLTLKNSPILTATVDRDLRITWAYNTGLDFTPENLQGKRLDELISPDQAAPLISSMQAVIDSDKGQRNEWNFIDEQGTEYTIDMIIEPLPAKEQEPTGISIVAIDISERKRLEKELIRRETQYRRMLNTTFDGVWIIDPEGKTSYINDQGADMLGYTPREMAGTDSDDYIFPEDLPEEAKNLKRRRQWINEYTEQRLRHKDGHEVWIRSSSAPLIVEDEDYHGVLMMFTNITPQKLAEVALRESNERFRIALNAAHINMFSMDTQLRYTWVYSPEDGGNHADFIGKRDEELMPPEEAAELTALKRSVIDNGLGTRKEMRINHPGGWKIYDLTLEPLKNEQGQIVGLSGAAIDVTGAHRMQQESLKNRSRVRVQHRLIQQREMERLHIASQLHDSVLQELIGIHFNFSEAINITDKDMRLQKMDAIQHEIREQIHALRDYCIELRPPSLAPFGLERAIRSHMSTFHDHYPGYHCSLNLYEDGKTLPEELRMALYRVYQEAMNNIIKHAGADHVWVRLSLRNDQVELEIRDNGKGFLLPEHWAEKMAHLGHFGLLGMQERLEAMGGKLRILTRSGKGTKIIGIVPIDHLELKETEKP